MLFRNICKKPREFLPATRSALAVFPLHLEIIQIIRFSIGGVKCFLRTTAKTLPMLHQRMNSDFCSNIRYY